MSDLDYIVSVSITADGSPLTRTGFGTVALVTSQESLATPTVDTYTSLAGVAADYATDSPTYRMASAVFSQDPRPSRLKVVKTGLQAAQSVKVTVQADASTSLKIYRPDGTTETITVSAGGSVSLTGAALATAINGGTSAVTASNNSGVVTIGNDTNGEVFFFELLTNLGDFIDETADPGIAAKLTAALAVDSDWYGVVVDVNSEAIIDAVAAWVEANDRLFVWSTANALELTSSGTIGAGLVSSGYERTAGIYHSKPWQYAACAWMGARLIDPDRGQKTWAFAELDGVTVDTLTPTQTGYLDTDRISHYRTLAGKNITFMSSATYRGGGIVASGEWIDIIHGTDWLRVRMQEDLAEMIINAGRVPYTQGGIDAVGSVILRRLKRGEAVGFLAPGSSSVRVPNLDDVRAADRQARVLRDVSFSATYASAIHYVDLVGNLSY